ncbi:hypothetical protein [Collimonas humicola]|uniref:hypothetical protein n=1 Tax=Collimonas humicola TaxID=2825886 RepID=UPI001B8BA23E|nr:hypothetical protein [Collimonas humicola]
MKFHKCCSPRAQGGQAIMEYILIVTVVAIVMFIPMPDVGVPQFVGKTPAEVLAFAFRNFFRGFSFLTSVL